ncbi:Reverse transcriptase domain-containing protein [Plasmodiophora brassicae]
MSPPAGKKGKDVVAPNRNGGKHPTNPIGLKTAQSSTSQTKDESRDIPEHIRKRFEGKDPPKAGCLICKEQHWVQVCPKATQGERKAAIEKFQKERKEKEESKGNADTAKRMGPPSPSTPSPMRLRFQNSLDLPFEADSGATKTVISQSQLLRIQAIQHVPVKVFDHPTEAKLATIGATTTIVATAIVDITIVPPSHGKPAHLRGREINVCREDLSDDIVLLGAPELDALGINPATQLKEMLIEANGPIIIEADPTPERHAPGGQGITMRAVRHPEVSGTTRDHEPQLDTNDPGDDYDVEIGEHSDTDVDRAIDRMIQRATDSGFPNDQVPRLRTTVNRHKDIWRTKLGRDPPAKVSPLKLHFKADARPVRCRTRRYTLEHQKFMDDHVGTLAENDFVYRNPHSRYASPCLVVDKKDTEVRGHRLTVDINEAVNKQTERIAWPMPHIDIILTYLRSATIFMLFDAFKGYWQFPLHPDSQEACSFMTHIATFTPRRIIQGIADCVFAFQAGMQQVLGKLLYICALLWIDDILGYVSGFGAYMDTLESLLNAFDEFGVKLNPDRCQLYLTSVTWCGRVISADGVSFDRSYLNALHDLSTPITAADLQQFLSGLNWVRSVIPQFAAHVHPLQDLLLSASRSVSSLKKSHLRRVRLADIGWTTDHLTSFNSLKHRLSEAMTLAHPKDEWIMCLFPDASDRFWSVFLSQIPPEDIDLPYGEQHHEPLSFISGTFRGSQLKWATIEKEAYAIIEGCYRLRHFISMSKLALRIFTDHRNLVFILNPASVARISRTTGDRLERWRLQIIDLDFHIEHIAGEDNVWADLATRWGVALQPLSSFSPPSFRSIRHMAINLDFDDYKMTDEFIWPSVDEISNAQTDYIRQHDLSAVSDILQLEGDMSLHLSPESGWRTPDNQLWVPSHALQLRIAVISHMGLSGHQPAASTISSIAQLFWWPDLDSFVRAFVDKCLHCLRNKDSMIPRPFGTAMHADKPNKVIHYDFLFLSKPRPGDSHQLRYVLVLKDDATAFVELIPCQFADHSVVAESLLDWFKRFGIVFQHVSDRGTHFKNAVIAELNSRLHCNHHFTTAYTPWANGTVEVVNKRLLFLLKSLLSELNLPFQDWPYVLPLINMTVNHTVRSSVGYAPVTMFTGLPPSTPISIIFNKRIDAVIDVPLTPDRLKEMTTELIDSLEDMHKAVARTRTHLRDLKQRARRRRRNVREINFTTGDYVLVANHGKHSKSEYNWTGPAQIIDTSNDWVYRVRDLLTDRISDVHAQRLMFYADAHLNVTSSLKHNIALTGVAYQVNAVEDIRVNSTSGDTELLINWIGFDATDNSWEPYSVMAADVPDIVRAFLERQAEGDPLCSRLLADF